MFCESGKGASASRKWRTAAIRNAGSALISVGLYTLLVSVRSTCTDVHRTLTIEAGARADEVRTVPRELTRYRGDRVILVASSYHTRRVKILWHAFALRLLDSFAIDWITCEPGILDRAAQIKNGARISVADSWIGATASVYGATLVHKDPEFEPLRDIPQEMLS